MGSKEPRATTLNFPPGGQRRNVAGVFDGQKIRQSKEETVFGGTGSLVLYFRLIFIFIFVWSLRLVWHRRWFRGVLRRLGGNLIRVGRDRGFGRLGRTERGSDRENQDHAKGKQEVGTLQIDKDKPKV